VLNDIVDIESDRANPNKKRRPFAAAEVRPVFGLIFALGLLIVSLSIASSISFVFLFLVLSYAGGTLCYSLFAKSLVIADIVLLAGFYTIRILAGGVACNITVSKWLLLFSVFFFLSLACIKRFCELASLGVTSASRRDYRQADQPLIRVMGVCAGFIAVLVLALWANSSEVQGIYPSPQFLWLLCPILLYWIGRIWIFAERGILHHDPVIFALKDRISYLVGFFTALLAYLAASIRLDTF
jgi:4-hydroxybenzoate polyprenyltransferase